MLVSSEPFRLVLLIASAVVFATRTAHADTLAPAAVPPADPAPAHAASAAPASTAPEEVRVVGRREPRPAIEQHLTRDQVRTMPGAFGDPFRAIDITPGFVPIVSGLPYFYVRGAPPSAVGYFVDEVRVPYLFHFLLGPGVVHPALIEDVSVQPAAYAARYGRFAGGVVAAKTREPSTELRGEGQLRFFDAGAYVEKPFADGRAVVGVGGRYSYTAALMSLVLPETTIDYRDYNARAVVAIGERWKATAFAFGSYDYASEVKNGAEHVYFASEFHRLDLRVDRRGADGATTRIATTVGIDRTRLEGTRFARDTLAGVRGRHRFPASKEVEVELGGDVQVDVYEGDLPNHYAVQIEDYVQAQKLFASRIETASGVWASTTFRPARGWDLTGTLRGDFFTSAGRSALGPTPRVSMRTPFKVAGAEVAFLGALGVAPQTPAYGVPIPAVGFRGLPGGLSYAFQKSAGVEVPLPLTLSLRTVGFHHTYLGMRDWSRESGRLQDPPDVQMSPAQAYGLEVFLSGRPARRLYTFVSATISRAQLGSTLYERARVSPFDRTHVVQAGGVLDLGRGWRASSRFLTYGGWSQSGAPTVDARIPQNELPTRPVGRLPGFFRLDVRLEKKWTFRNERWLALVLEGLNVTGTKEVLARRCDVLGEEGRKDAQGCINETLGPIVIPSIGLEGGL
jgi:hypothetical protein